ncbi:MAG: hypothetical protein KJ067_25885 [Vicinamibacteria bacterium]|nr:hypothetical protein [Vicinamibacteria bacterium]
MTAAEFWDSTPRELATFLAAATQRLQEDFRLARYAAWVQVSYAKRSRLPPLASVLEMPAGRRRGRASWRDQLAQVSAIHTLLTGRVVPDSVRRVLDSKE